jgi:putative nucleotidyltransferase with HDIG domain
MKRETIKSFILQWIKNHKNEFYQISDFMWDNPELGLEEFKASEMIKNVLKKHGFKIESNIGGMPTSFIAEYGSSQPVIGLNVEYDCLPGLSQKKNSTFIDPIQKGAPGQGCGHNILGPAAVMAGVALRYALEKFNISATIKLFGSPYEESSVGKPVMGKAGAYKDLGRPVAVKLLQTLAVEEPEVREVTKLLSADPGLSAEIMTLANSALYGLPVPVRTVARAVSVLGLERMKSVALTAAMQSFTRQAPETEARRSAWRHSLACAFVAEELAAAYGQTREASYMAGLMHDVGRFGLMAAYPLISEQAFSTVYGSGADALEGERQQFGMDHAQAGACLAQVWALPEEFRAVAAHHHDDGAARESSAVGLARTACLAADALGFEGVRKSAAPQLDEIAASLPERLGRALREASGELSARLGERFQMLDNALAP